MNAKPFVLLLVGVLVLGGVVGGALIGAIALAKGQGAESVQNGQPAALTSSLSQQPSTQFSQGFQGQFDHADGQGFSGRAGLTGTIEKIEDDTVMVSTAQGQLQANIGADTTIQRYADVTLADLRTGLRVTVIGGRGENGTVQARTILVIPEGEDDFIGRGFFSSSRQQHDPQSSRQLSQGQHSQFGQQSQGQFDHADGQGFSGRAGLTGTIEKIEGSTLTLNTPQGPLQATVGESTTIRRFTEAVLPDLLEGMRVTVTGQRGEDGAVQARSILVIPEGAEGGFGGDFFSRDHQEPDQQ